ncbi:MAG: hypothetical protein MUC35_05975 [Candidatus Margulisbacteria bacterium]|jgi:hypothetical protein|nr:hypothetical protein [Candidatus Margulisiibacteriota bacterium]
MNIGNVNPNIINDAAAIKPANKQSSSSQAQNGPSFAANLSQLAKSANLQIADGNSAALLNLNKQKEEKLEKLFSFSEEEEKALESSIDRIRQLLNDLGHPSKR